MRFRDRPTLRLGGDQPEPQVIREYLGLLPPRCLGFLEFIATQPGQPFWRTALDKVPSELVDWDAIKFCVDKDWVRFEPDYTFSITPEGIRVFNEQVLYANMLEKEVGDDEVIVREVPGQPKRTPALEVSRVVGDRTIDSAIICGPALVRLFQVVEELSASVPAGDFPNWSDVRAAYVRKGNWKGRIIGEKTLRDYARRIERALRERNLGGLWHHTSEGVRWR